MTGRLRPSTVSSTYSVILEFAVPSYRSDKARKNGTTDDNYTKPAKSNEK